MIPSVPRYETPMIKKIRYRLLLYDTLFDTLIGDALSITVNPLLRGAEFHKHHNPKFISHEPLIKTK
jgi:hypothetical protein